MGAKSIMQQEFVAIAWGEVATALFAAGITAFLLLV
jgi:hypothetical protein